MMMMMMMMMMIILDIEIIEVRPRHPRERLKGKLQERDEYNKIKSQHGYDSSDNNDVQITDVQLLHLSKRLRLINKNKNIKK